MAAAIVGQDRFQLSQAITMAESQIDTDIASYEQLTNILSHYTPSVSIRIAISGAPGVGKSTFIEQFGLHLLSLGKRVAVLAIDPSSSVTHGSILGDKTRMDQLSNHPSAYIRPSAAGLTLGGVHQATRESISLCEYAGYDIILIETVGVGQSETIASSMSDIFVLLLIPGGGDEIQGIKRGIVELADIVIVNKADTGREDLANQSKKAYENALSLFKHPLKGWKVPVLLASGYYAKGLDALWRELVYYTNLAEASGFTIKKRTQQELEWLHKVVEYEFHKKISKNTVLSDTIVQAESDIKSHKASSQKIINQVKSIIRGL